jgi:hypothetical protein
MDFICFWVNESMMLLQLIRIGDGDVREQGPETFVSLLIPRRRIRSRGGFHAHGGIGIRFRPNPSS